MSKTPFNPQNSVIIIDAVIKAQKSAITHLVLDTGASTVVLGWRLTTAIGIVIDPKRVTHTTTASAVETVPQIVIPEINALGKTIKRVPAIVKDLPPESGVDGLLGLSFLRHFRLTIDFPAGILQLD